MTENVWNKPTAKAPKEEEPPKQAPLRAGETPTNTWIRLCSGELVGTEAQRLIGQGVVVRRKGEQEYAATRSGLHCTLEELIAFAGSDDPLKLKAASDNYAPPDYYEPERHPSPPPGSYTAHTTENQEVRIISKTIDPENGKERLVSSDGRLWVNLDYSPVLMLRDDHRAAYPHHYPASQLGVAETPKKGSSSNLDKAPEGGI